MIKVAKTTRPRNTTTARTGKSGTSGAVSRKQVAAREYVNDRVTGKVHQFQYDLHESIPEAGHGPLLTVHAISFRDHSNAEDTYAVLRVEYNGVDVTRIAFFSGSDLEIAIYEYLSARQKFAFDALTPSHLFKDVQFIKRDLEVSFAPRCDRWTGQTLTIKAAIHEARFNENYCHMPQFTDVWVNDVVIENADIYGILSYPLYSGARGVDLDIYKTTLLHELPLMALKLFPKYGIV